MSYLFLIAFVAGAFSVLTPCILPVLPALVVVSDGQGRARVVGIVSGIVLSFCAVILLLTAIVDALGISADVLRYVSATMLLLFGLVLVVPALEERFQQATQVIVRRSPRQARGNGFVPGFLAGTTLGFVWAPCAGPILGGITSTVAREGLGPEALVATAGYGLGMVIPLTAVAFGGRTLMVRIRKAAAGGRRVNVAMGVILLLTSALFFSGLDTRVNRFIANTLPFTSTPVASLERAGFDDNADVRTTRSCSEAQRLAADRKIVEANGYPEVGKLCDLGPAPAFADDLGPWLNTATGKPITPAELRGKVVLVDFWTYSCINCIRTLPYLRGWHDRYSRDGLVIVGVHTPEFAFERSLDNVRKATRDLDVRWPVALDNRYDTWNNFANRFWPSKYLIDRDGRLRAVHYGEGAYDRTEEQIRQLLGIRAGAAKADARGAVTDVSARTPETYLGFQRAARFAGRATDAPKVGSGFTVNRAATYRPPAGELGVDMWSYAGQWTVSQERAVAGREARLLLRYRAREAYLVMSPPSGRSVSVRVTVDGRERPPVRVTANQLYTVASDERSGTRRLELSVPKGTSVYAFTFG
jgi:cytochrome c biogenesis protein CcdA/thiol-disulfide isomerase/thioredoxin